MRDMSDAEILRRAIDARLLDVRTSVAGVVVSFDAATWTATIRPAVRFQAVDADSPPEVDTLQPIEGVPVQFPHWGEAVLYHPLSPGDVGRLEWSEEDDGEVYSDDGAEVPVNPTILRRHGAACVFRPEGKRGGGISEPEASAGFLGRPGGVGIAFDQNEVRLGSATAVEAVALASLVKSMVAEAITGHGHGSFGAAGVFIPPLTAETLTSAAAAKVKAE